jgi:HD-GYP domain-containing protein (c-di-GMP phosphodiesterase class II)/CHASE2 domain-containing sensor protein
VASLLGRLSTVAQGRKIASLVLFLIIIIEALAIIPKAPELYFAQTIIDAVKQIRQPVVSARQALFDAYQKVYPRIPISQPLTVIAIDEKSIHQVGQWPWPRNKLADLINIINARNPAAIGLDFYMPEADRQSVENFIQLIPKEHQLVREQLQALPTNDLQLAMALSSSPSVVAAVGFNVNAYTSSDSLTATPAEIIGSDPLPFVVNYPQVLANLPILTHSASGQALLSVSAQVGAIRRFPLISAVNDQLIASMPVEMLRVATGSAPLKIQATQFGIENINVADLNILTQANGDIWPYYASIEHTRGRYLSAVDVLNETFDERMLEGKLVIIGLTGAGLSDMRFTSLGEHVPGVEVIAQVVEGLYENNLLKRANWLSLLELMLVIVIGGALIAAAPKFQSLLERSFRYNPYWLALYMVSFIVLIMGGGLVLFIFTGILFSSISVLIGTLMVCGVFVVNAILINLRSTQTKLARLMQSGVIFARQQKKDQLLELIQDYLHKIAPHQCSLIFLINNDQELELAANRGLLASWAHLIAIKAIDSAGLYHQWLSEMLCKGESKQLTGAQALELLPLFSTNLQKAINGPIYSLIILPMLAADRTVKGLTVLCNAKTTVGTSLTRFDRHTLRLINALTMQATVALENQQLVKSQQNMMDAVVKILAGTIDKKSPYTGGHCERVPILAQMLCEVACESERGALSEFAFSSEEEWREFKMAAWMHDCGKITTPENVVDKATKLEMIYNRIHEVRTRFEVLLRDAQVTRLEAIYEQGLDKIQADNQFEQRKQQLIQDFTFIAQRNTGGEYQSAEQTSRIEQIGQQTWQRHFDDRLGLSHIELMRYPERDEVKLPITEQLLSNRVEHLIERPYSKVQEQDYGFKMDIPELLNNHGELHNLQVSRGTLTKEERFIINDHIIQTIVILDQIPFPPNLRRVSEIAGAHHETLIGTGYPRKLTEKELSVPARVLAIADIFEALTAADRPYKKAKTLSEAIHILHSFKRKQHIDPLLFDLFLSEGVYLKYAEQFLTPAQIDVVDINKYLG